MTNRIRITTTIDEINDSAGRNSPRCFSEQLTGRLSQDKQTGKQTDLPAPADDDNSRSRPSYDNRDNQPTIGRTFADLVIECKNDYRTMAVLLTIASFVIFAAKIDSIESLKYPVITAFILNLIWIVAPMVVTSLRWFKRER